MAELASAAFMGELEAAREWSNYYPYLKLSRNSNKNKVFSGSVRSITNFSDYETTFTK